MSTTIDLCSGLPDEYPTREISGNSIQIPIRPGSIRQIAADLDIGVSSSVPISESKTIETSESNPLPERDPLLEGLAQLQYYLDDHGLAFIADSHLRGEAAPVRVTDRVLYATVGEDLFDSLRTDLKFEMSDEVWSAIQVLYTLEVALASDAPDDHPAENASWPAVTGRQVDATCGFVTSVDFPLESIDSNPMVQGRGLGLGAGAQRLASDANLMLDEVGPYYLFQHLTAVTDSHVNGTDVLSAIAEMFSMDVVAVDQTCVRAADHIAEAADAGRIVLSPEAAAQRYYLAEEISPMVTDAFSTGSYDPQY